MSNRPRDIALKTVVAMAAVLVATLFPTSGKISAQTPESLDAAEPGQLVRWQELPAIGGHPAWRILYVSTGLDGEPTAISGTIAIPGGPAPDGGFPVLAIGHPTAGLGRECAPSLDLQRTDSFMGSLYRQILTPYLEAGFALVMTDYQGLGTAGNPSYLIGKIEGQNILDAIRAAREFPLASLSEQTLLIGHSQGGHAVAFTLQAAPEYAPELAFDGAVLAAPAIDPLGIFEELTSSNAASENTALILFVMSAWSETYPQASLDQVTTPAGAELIATSIADGCLLDATLAASEAVPSEIFLPDAEQAWAELAAENTPAPGPWDVPVLVVQGVEDEVIGIGLTADFVDRLCDNGVVVEFRDYPATNHFGVLPTAVSDMIDWLLGRVAGDPAPSTCRSTT